MRDLSRLSTSRLPSTRFTASRGAMAGKAAPDSTAAARTRRTRVAVASGRAASCTRTKSHSPSAARPARTDSCRLLPPARTVTGLRGASDTTSRSAFSRRLGGPTTTIRSTSSSARKSSRTRARVVRPLRRTYALTPRRRRSRRRWPLGILFALGAGVALAVLAGGLSEDHPARRGLDHGRHDRCDGLVHQAPPVLDDDHRTVVKAAHTLAGFLALARDCDHDFLARDRDRPHRLRQLVEVEDCDAFEPRDPVEVEVVRHDPPALALGCADEVRVDLGVGRHIVLHHLQVDGRILLHLAQHVEPATAASPAGCIGGVGNVLELTKDRAQRDEWHIDEARLGDVEYPPVDDD